MKVAVARESVKQSDPEAATAAPAGGGCRTSGCGRPGRGGRSGRSGSAASRSRRTISRVSGSRVSGGTDSETRGRADYRSGGKPTRAKPTRFLRRRRIRCVIDVLFPKELTEISIHRIDVIRTAGHNHQFLETAVGNDPPENQRFHE